MKRNSIISTIVVALALIFLMACNEDNPVQEQLGEISGTVTFVGTWPATGDVQISAWTEWPPAGPPAAASDPFQQPANNTVDYKLEALAKGTYKAITFGWRDPNNPQQALVLGVYWAQKDSVGVSQVGFPVVAPLELNVADGSLIFSDIDMAANLDIVP